MTDSVMPTSEAEVESVLRWAASEKATLEIVAGGSKRSVGGPVAAQRTLDVSGLVGIESFEPEELVLVARPGTPMVEVEAVLAEAGQYLPFEPPDFGKLLGSETCVPTLGGIVAGNLSGPRRIKCGAARDHVLGMSMVTGRGERIKTGGRVVKNVTGYDLSKLLTGSWGTLAVMTEIAVKTLPMPESVETLIVEGLDDAVGTALLSDAMGSPHEVSGAAHLPGGLSDRLGIDVGETSATCLRLEGIAASVRARRDGLASFLGARGPVRVLDTRESNVLWSGIRKVLPFVQRDGAVWRLSVAPAEGAAVVRRIRELRSCEAFYDWSGGLVWLLTEAQGDAGVEAIRSIIGDRGHATLVRAPASVRSAVSPFHPQSAALAALSNRVREGFDPLRILNPGRMTASTA